MVKFDNYVIEKEEEPRMTVKNSSVTPKKNHTPSSSSSSTSTSSSTIVATKNVDTTNNNNKNQVDNTDSNGMARQWRDIGVTAGSSLTDIKPILLENIYSTATGMKKRQIVLNGFVTSMCMAGENLLLVSAAGMLYQYSLDTFNKKKKNTGDQSVDQTRDPIVLSSDQIVVFMATNPVNPDHLYFATPKEISFINIRKNNSTTNNNNNNNSSNNSNSNSNNNNNNSNNKDNDNNGDNNVPKYLLTTSCPRGIVIHGSGNYMAVYSDTEYLVIVNLQTGNQKHYHSQDKITSVAFHPVQLTLSFGTSQGRIHHIQIGAANFSLRASGYLHWHATPVTALEYSCDGNLLLSGGYESTLTIWTTATQRRNFLPRLGGAINYINISPSTTYAAVTLKNNAIKIVSLSDLSIVSVIRGLRKANSIFTADQNTVTLASYGGDGTIQFFSPRKNLVTGELVVVPPNNSSISTTKAIKLSSSEANHNPFELPTSVVTHVAFHSDSTMATFEQRIDEQDRSQLFVRDQILKFWNLDENSNYQCFFSVTCPHNTPILSLQFHPKLPILLTGAEQDFKVWQRKDERWSCVFTGGYESLPIQSVAFSKDGSVFAASAGHNTTLWKLKDYQFITNITNTSTYTPIRDLHFLHNDEYLLTGFGDYGLTVWNLATLTPILSVTERIDSVAVSPDAERFAISGFLSEPNNFFLAVFNDQFQCETVEVTQFPVRGLVFVREAKALAVYYSPFAHCVCGISIPDSVSASTSASNKLNALNDDMVKSTGVLPTNVKLHFKNTKKENKKKNAKPDWEQEAKKMVEKEIGKQQEGVQVVSNTANQLFNVASHIIPGVQSIYQSFMDSMLTTKTSTQPTANESNSSTTANIKVPQVIQPQIQPKQLKFDLSSLSSLQYYFDDKTSTILPTKTATTTTTTNQNKQQVQKPVATAESTNTTPAPTKINKNYKASSASTTTAATPQTNKNDTGDKRKREEGDNKENQPETSQAKKKQATSETPITKKTTSINTASKPAAAQTSDVKSKIPTSSTKKSTATSKPVENGSSKVEAKPKSKIPSSKK
ncbi:WD40 repeat-containing protein [Heterostelium album PN500]|uniref:WD40 repeat-containing protein n=1 Tax=Heterostelium pallidum (strain ATCC 26659 / Pp 5 / PN500) TaxID=670386 RepID=D3B6F9_HETP5|nr:WD40 repeat-containing protein [Heterostelium album PN500]EFA82929.1 WD40 repeat-containing protein [Heterostelium album PN500]|eukprot:XP_020435046.1 WD40 repeat-containing protein [Heterostelium album PN500]